MHIYGPSQLHGPQSIGSPHGVRAGPADDPSRGRRRSPTKLTFPKPLGSRSRVQQMPEMRRRSRGSGPPADRRRHLRNRDKLNAAIERLLDEIG